MYLINGWSVGYSMTWAYNTCVVLTQTKFKFLTETLSQSDSQFSYFYLILLRSCERHRPTGSQNCKSSQLCVLRLEVALDYQMLLWAWIRISWCLDYSYTSTSIHCQFWTKMLNQCTNSAHSCSFPYFLLDSSKSKTQRYVPTVHILAETKTAPKNFFE